MRARIFFLFVVTVGLALGPVTPAGAQAAFYTAGGPAGQYLILDHGELRFAGYISVPLLDPIPHEEPPLTEGLGTVTNHDPVPHTITECTSDCDRAAPGGAGGRYDIYLPARGSASFKEPIYELILQKKMQRDETLVFYCTVHPWMRGAITIDIDHEELPPPPDEEE